MDGRTPAPQPYAWIAEPRNWTINRLSESPKVFDSEWWSANRNRVVLESLARAAQDAFDLFLEDLERRGRRLKSMRARDRDRWLADLFDSIDILSAATKLWFAALGLRSPGEESAPDPEFTIDRKTFSRLTDDEKHEWLQQVLRRSAETFNEVEKRLRARSPLVDRN
jgi:hypothetical protein